LNLKIEKITMKYLLLTTLLLAFKLKLPAQIQPPLPVQALLDSLQKLYAPDKRTALFEVSIQIADSGRQKIRGSTDQPEALEALEAAILKDYPSFDTEVELLPGMELGKNLFAITNVSVANLRTEPRHGAELATQALLGTPLKLLRKRGDWY